jgi:hypothetical protein
MQHRVPIVFICFAFLLCAEFSCRQLVAADLHVATTGNDTNPGTPAAPLKSLAAARDSAHAFAGTETVRVFIADGVYYLPETLVFTAADSGSKVHPVTYRAVNEGGAVLSGGSKLDLQWRVYRE